MFKMTPMGSMTRLAAVGMTFCTLARVHAQDVASPVLPDYRIGPVPVLGDRAGWQVAAFYEFAKFEVDEDTIVLPDAIGPSQPVDVECTRFGVAIGVNAGRVAADILLGAPLLEGEDSTGVDADPGFLAGGRVAANFATLDRVAFGTDLTITGNQSQLTIPNLSAVPIEVDLKWVQYDWRVGAAFLPSRDAAAALAPFAGVGYRGLDGVEESDALPGIEPEFKASLFYGFAGLSAHSRSDSGTVLTGEVTGMVGDVTGISISLALIF